jgi:hypothetical protein
MSDYIPFHAAVPIQGSTTAKVANPAKEPENFSNLSRISSLPPQNGDPHPLPLSPTYPCVVCLQDARWSDHGIWRCMACWPPRALGRKEYSV